MIDVGAVTRSFSTLYFRDAWSDGPSGALFASSGIEEVQLAVVPPVAHILHRVLFSSALWYLQQPVRSRLWLAGCELVKQRCVCVCVCGFVRDDTINGVPGVFSQLSSGGLGG